MNHQQQNPDRRWPTGPFEAGVNLPWISYGNDVGANLWHPDGGVGTPDRRHRLSEALHIVANEGGSLVRWFLFCDGRSGFLMDANGQLAGLDRWVWRDVEAAIEELARARIRAVFVLVDFSWFERARWCDGVQLGGRSAWLTAADQRQRFFDLVLAPLFERTGREDAIAAWDIVNEPEWVTRPAPWHRWRGRTSRSAMRAFLADAVSLIHTNTQHAATVGCASAWSLPLVQGLGLDIYQVHWYDQLELRAPLTRPVCDMGLDGPILLGEYPTRGSARSPSDIVSLARAAGYAGALSWSLLADDSASNPRTDGMAAGIPQQAIHR